VTPHGKRASLFVLRPSFSLPCCPRLVPPVPSAVLLCQSLPCSRCSAEQKKKQTDGRETAPLKHASMQACKHASMHSRGDVMPSAREEGTAGVRVNATHCAYAWRAGVSGHTGLHGAGRPSDQHRSSGKCTRRSATSRHACASQANTCVVSSPSCPVAARAVVHLPVSCASVLRSQLPGVGCCGQAGLGTLVEGDEGTGGVGRTELMDECTQRSCVILATEWTR
jgi:hypothetical protein